NCPLHPTWHFTTSLKLKMRPRCMTNLLCRFAAVHYRREGLCVQARPADERAVQLFLGHQSLNIVGFDATTVQNPQGLGLLGGEFPRRALSQEPMRRCGNFRRSRLARANCPNWLVGYQNTGELFGGQRAWTACKLGLTNFFGAPGFAVLPQFADANDWSQPRGNRFFRLLPACFR